MHWNIADIFEAVVDGVPADRVAVISHQNGEVRRLTYPELDARANQLAHFLESRGVKAGDHVGFYLYNSIELVETHLAAWKIRAVPINVNYRYVEDELRYLFDNADLVAVVHGREFAPRIAAVLADCPKLTTLIAAPDGTTAELAPIGGFTYEDAIADQSTERGFAERSDDDLYVLYTGGTTGMPKGVMWRQEDFYKSTIGPLIALGQPAINAPEEQAKKAAELGGMLRMFPLAPLMHGAAQWVALMCLLRGDVLILSNNRRFDPVEIWGIISREGANSVSIVGDAMARPLVEALDDPAVAKLDTSNLVVIGSGGAILSAAVKAEIAERLPNVIVTDNIGASETGFQGSLSGNDAEGRPQFQMGDDTVVLDDSGRPLEPGTGVIGRLARCGNIPLGYYKDPVKTAATFVEYDGRRWVLPGDMALVEADGTITLLGRGSVSINSGGEKIYPEEVEAALKGHEDVFDVVVVGVPDERWGERVVAVVKARPGTTITLEELTEHTKRKLASYKAPRALVLVDEVVRSPSGKADYRWAKATALAAESPPS